MAKVAIVTGSNKGIGLAIVRGLCRQFKGDVHLTSRNPKLGKEAVTQLEGEGLAPKYHQLDITSLESIETLKKFMVEKYGGVDVLVNNAGIAYKSASPIEQATVTTNVNFTGTLNMMRAFVSITKPHGRIANVSGFVGALSRLTSSTLRDRFSSPTLTEAEVVALMDEFISAVREGNHREKGWPNTFYGITKIGVTAMTKVFAREVEKSGKGFIIWLTFFNC